MDPRLSAAATPVFWIPAADPGTIILGGAPVEPGPSAIDATFVLAQQPPAGGPDASYRRLAFGGVLISALLVESLTDKSALAAIVLLDADTPDRVEAVQRFWSFLHATPAPDPRLTAQRRQRLRQMLRAVDARIARSSYRAIADGLFPDPPIDAASWAGNALRETTIRLVRDGMKLVQGGYRSLLRRPRKS